MYNVIRRTILEMDKPFSINELFKRLEEKKIRNHLFILKILYDLMNQGLITCPYIEDDNAIYCSAFANKQ